MQKSVTILGSTGSVGVNALSVIREHPSLFRVAGLAAASKIETIEQQIIEFSPKVVYLKDPVLAKKLSEKYKQVRVFSENEGLTAFAEAANADVLLAASSGTSALLPVLEAIRKNKRVALANKEILVIAGGLVMTALKDHPQASLVPVDSEHSAIFQCLQGSRPEHIEKIILTGSGGPLREMPKEEFGSLTKEVVINHPRWKMGQKISVDSATMMNKGLEIIEASWLFDIPVNRVSVLIHPEAIIHSMVEFRDGSVLAQLGVTDMRLPIQYALSYPDRVSTKSTKLDFSQISSFTFHAPDRKKFPCLDIAYQAAKESGSAPCVLSAADEVAVGAYLLDEIGFLDIPRVIEKVLSGHRHVSDPNLEQIQDIHNWAAEETRKICQAL